MGHDHRRSGRCTWPGRLRRLAKDPAERFPGARSLENVLGFCRTGGPWT